MKGYLKSKGRILWPGILAFILLSNLAYAQLNLNTTIRPRTELRNGYRHLLTEDQKAAFFISQRTRLGLDYQQDVLQFKISVQDVRVWGESSQLTEPASMSLHEGYGQVELSDEFSMRLGRQEWAYGAHRLLGSVNWTQQARSHDGLLLKYHDESTINADLGLAFNQQSERVSGTYFPRNDYKFLSFIWLDKSFNDASLSLVGIVDGHQIHPEPVPEEREVVFRQTLGFNGSLDVDPLQLNGGFYYQGGEDVQNLPISAFMAHLSVAYDVNPFKLTAGSDYISGNKENPLNRTKNKAFNTLYATNHKFYGYMDYFLNIPNDTGNKGLHDNYLKADLQLDSKFSGGVHAHYFALASSLNYFSNEEGEVVEKRGLGAEIDLVLGYQFDENIKFNGGVSSLFASNTLDFIQGDNNLKNGQWAWLMVSITPSVQLWSAEE